MAELMPAVTGVSTGGEELLQQCLVCEPGAWSVMHFHCGSCGLAEAEALIMSFQHRCWGGNKVRRAAPALDLPGVSTGLRRAGTARVESHSPATAWLRSPGRLAGDMTRAAALAWTRCPRGCRHREGWTRAPPAEPAPWPLPSRAAWRGQRLAGGLPGRPSALGSGGLGGRGASAAGKQLPPRCVRP